MTRRRSRDAETEDVVPRRLKRGAIERVHVAPWAIGRDELAPGVVGDTHLGPRIVNETHIHPTTYSDLKGVGQLVVMSAAGDSIDPGGDHVTFDIILDQQGGFADLASPGASWVHPVTATYVITYEHVWDSYKGGATVDIEIDGLTSLSRRIGSGSVGQTGRGAISYYAEAGQVGKIKVTHSDGSAQTCDAAMWLSVSDPLGAVTGHTAELYVNDTLVAWTDETLSVDHTGAATILLGETAAESVAGVYGYDDASLTHDAVDLISNGGFESAVAGTGTSTAVTTGNWRIYDPGSGTTELVASPAHSGSSALSVTALAGTSNGGYAFQDVTLPEGDAFEYELWVRPTSGEQDGRILFDWDRANTSAESIHLHWTASSLATTVFGVALQASDALTVGEWANVRLVVAAQEVT